MPLPPSSAFLSAPPVWSLAGKQLACADLDDAVLEQHPFRWSHGMWESETRVIRPDGVPTHVVRLRIARETLRRWREAGIDPAVEACAQLTDHLNRQSSRVDDSVLTLL
ncbi:MAG TPA: hypothetical protein VNJ02_14540 [Vicinamibacterales bacterium]|nr:hypothetical protein [Vicinamibacterales bacterium]